MLIDDVVVSRSIIESYKEKLLANLQMDAALVGAGPANMVTGYYLGKAGIRAAVFESKLAPGGGMWSGGMMFNEVSIQEDALHIAVAAVNGMDVMVTWNFAHLNNPFTRKAVRRIVEREGYVCPEICSPQELLEVDK